MASAPTEDLLKAYGGLTSSAVVLAAPPPSAAPIAHEEDDLTTAKRIASDASDPSDATGRMFIALSKAKLGPADRCTIADLLRREKTSLSTAAA